VNPAAHQELLRYVAEIHGARSAANFDWAMRKRLFAGIDLEGKTMLDIGCGHGRMGLWAAARGARRVVGLEPEAEGSSSGMQEAFDAAARRVGLANRVELVTKPLQEYEIAERFDVVLLAGSFRRSEARSPVFMGLGPLCGRSRVAKVMPCHWGGDHLWSWYGKARRLVSRSHNQDEGEG
jgi:SAM-dependent methyltransferase